MPHAVPATGQFPSLKTLDPQQEGGYSPFVLQKTFQKLHVTGNWSLLPGEVYSKYTTTKYIHEIQDSQ